MSRLRETVLVRQAADVLLDDLLLERVASEQRLVENGGQDPMRCVTGRSAIDRAIGEARAMIDDMDRLLAEMNTELEAVTAGA